MKKKLKKILIASLVVLNFFSLSGLPVYGDTFSLGNPTEAMDKIFEDLGVNKTELKNTIKTVNVSRMKKTPPLVSLTFLPENPLPGEKITAQATPTYFMNETKNLYFTWFLKRKSCKKNNNNNDCTIEDYKEVAARIIANDDFEWEKASASYDGVRGCGFMSGGETYRGIIGGNDQEGKNDHCFIHDVKTGNEYEIECGHLFPKRRINCCPCCRKAIITTPGDGMYCSLEEKFWHTDPNNPDTAGTGNGDEANVIGLGVDKFTWTYEAGDEIGVAVEGISVEPTSYADSSYKTMWAFSDNKCDPVGVEGKGPNEMIRMSVDNMNDCLTRNLINPLNMGAENEKLEVSLKYLPETPINDLSANKDGDELSLTASVTNATNPAFLNYTWEVYAADSPNPDSWGVALLKNALDGATQTSGLGVSTFGFKLNFSQPKKYLKIKVTVKDTITSGTRKGHTDVVVPIFSSEERIKVYTAKTSPELKVDFNTDGPADSPQERCLFTDPDDETKKTPQSVCEVAKNELIALGVENEHNKYSDFLWTIDGKTQTCPDDNFIKCLKDGKSTERTYFPILKNPGDQYNVELSMLNATTGERLSLVRTFKVSVPEVKIVPKEGAAPNYTCRGILLGNYIDFKGTEYEDHSDTKFQALTGSNIELKPEFFGTATPKNTSDLDYAYKWSVDGVAINADNASEYGYTIDPEDYGKLTLPPKDSGTTYLVSFSTMFTPTNETKQILNKYWNVTYNEFYEKKLTHNIEIEMVDGGPLAKKENTKNKIFATVSSGIPSYIAFLFRIVLSGAAIIFAIKIIFFVLPKTKTDEF
jgi:hypothetical protein